MKFEAIWKKYKINELGVTSLFSKMERIKITSNIIY